MGFIFALGIFGGEDNIAKNAKITPMRKFARLQYSKTCVEWTLQGLKCVLYIYSQSCLTDHLYINTSCIIMSATRPKRTKIGNFSAHGWNLPKMYLPTC